jgi:hypothetical protein
MEFKKQKSRMVWVLALMLLGGAAIGSGVYGYRLWEQTRPTEKNFDAVMRQQWDKQFAAIPGYRSAGAVRPKLCVTLPSYPEADSRSKSHGAMAWHMDFYRDTPANAQRNKQLEKFDALAKAGFLERTEEVLQVNAESRPVNRYRLTDKGWAATGDGSRGDCFIYGETQYLGIKSFEAKVADSTSGLDMYLVKAKTGVLGANELAPWARDPAVQAAFPEIGKALEGQDFSAMLVRGRGKWVDYQSLMREQALRSNPELAPLPPAELSAEAKKVRDELNALAPPTIDEVKALLRKSHGDGDPDAWPNGCLYLPGAGKLRVDKDLSRGSGGAYAIAIYTSKPRTPYDQVAQRTIPYIDKLEQLGVLVKHSQSVQGEGKDASVLFEASIYELMPALQPFASQKNPGCLSMGVATVDFVDVQILNKSSDDFPETSVNYKLRISYTTPPAWTKEPLLLAGWSDMRGAVQRGRACNGKFGFDRKNRTLSGGSGSCWWAYENIEDGTG